MKFLNTTVIFLTAFSLSAQAQKMPEYLRGAEIKVTLKNGKEYTFKSEEYAVVRRDGMGKTKAVRTQLAETTRKIKQKKLVKNRKNRVYGLLGYGPTGGLNTSTNGQRYEIEHDNGAVYGVGYQRKVTEKVNLGVQIQSNETTSLSVGLDF